MALVDGDRSLSITSGVVDELSAATDVPFGCYLAGPNDPLADEARRLERAVFFETFGNTEAMLQAEYGLYEDASVFIVVVDHLRSRVAGMIRLILDKHGHLKSMVDIEAEPWNMPLDEVMRESGLGHFRTHEALDVATLAVDPEYRKGASSDLVSFALYRAVVQTNNAAGMKWLVTILDVVVLELIQTKMLQPFSFYSGVEPKRYLDSPSSVPVFCEMEPYLARVRGIDPAVEEMLSSDVGFESVITSADYERAAEVIRSLLSTAAVSPVG